jgi:ribosomal protein S18 acetylase RimI-like enzyme
MSNISFVSLKQLDLKLVTSLYNQVYTDYYFNIFYDNVSFKKYLKSLPANLDVSCVIKKDNEPVGLVIVSTFGNQAWISSFGIIHKYRKLGLGEKLLNKTINSIKSLDINNIGLEVLDYNQPANKLYKKFGFTLKSKLTSLEGYIVNNNHIGCELKQISSEDAYSLIEDDLTHVWSRRKHSFKEKEIKWVGLYKGSSMLSVMGYDIDDCIIVKRIEIIDNEIDSLNALFSTLSKQSIFNKKFYLLNFSDNEMKTINVAKMFGLKEFLIQNLLVREL